MVAECLGAPAIDKQSWEGGIISKLFYKRDNLASNNNNNKKYIFNLVDLILALKNESVIALK